LLSLSPLYLRWKESMKERQRERERERDEAKTRK